MIVVVDTNVFVAALAGPGGASRRILRACMERRLEPLMGMALLAEYESVLGRDEIWHRSVLSADERELILNAFLSVCRWTRIYFLWRPNLPDEGDNHLIELAVAGGAEVLVTRNVRDFRHPELLFPGLRVLSPESLSQEIESWVP